MFFAIYFFFLFCLETTPLCSKTLTSLRHACGKKKKNMASSSMGDCLFVGEKKKKLSVLLFLLLGHFLEVELEFRSFQDVAIASSTLARSRRDTSVQSASGELLFQSGVKGSGGLSGLLLVCGRFLGSLSFLLAERVEELSGEQKKEKGKGRKRKKKREREKRKGGCRDERTFFFFFPMATP